MLLMMPLMLRHISPFAAADATSPAALITDADAFSPFDAIRALMLSCACAMLMRHAALDAIIAAF